jgi:lipid II:glycine glycyltransferase (peptidoglycan interpeptide bridge formation enzyme)
VEVFNKIHLEVVKVQKFIPFSLDYFKKEFSVFSKDNEICIFFAKYKGEIAAASYVIFWSGIGFYHHAALLPEYHKIPLAYALEWESIKEAKRRGCKLYDFWGYVSPQESPKHPWAGPTLFKMGFGGRDYKYVKTQDFPLSKKYWLTCFFEKLRKIKRGYN